MKMPTVVRPNHTAIINGFEDYEHSFCMWLRSETEAKDDGTHRNKGVWISKEHYHKVMSAILNALEFDGDDPNGIMKMRVKYRNVKKIDADGVEHYNVVITGRAE